MDKYSEEAKSQIYGYFRKKLEDSLEEYNKNVPQAQKEKFVKPLVDLIDRCQTSNLIFKKFLRITTLNHCFDFTKFQYPLVNYNNIHNSPIYELTKKYGTKWFYIRNGKIVRNFYPKTSLLLILLGSSIFCYQGIEMVNFHQQCQRQIENTKKESQKLIKDTKQIEESYNKGFENGVQSVTKGQIQSTLVHQYLPLLVYIENQKQLEKKRNELQVQEKRIREQSKELQEQLKKSVDKNNELNNKFKEFQSYFR